MNIGAQARELTKIQIYRYVAGDKFLDVIDLLAHDPAHSKVAFTLAEIAPDTQVTQRVRHYVDSDEMKLLCCDLVAGTFGSFEDQNGFSYEGHCAARVLSFKKETRYRQPFVLRIDNGLGEEYGSGQVKMVKATRSLTIHFTETEARKMGLIVLDYIRAWESRWFSFRQDARAVLFRPDTKDL